MCFYKVEQVLIEAYRKHSYNPHFQKYSELFKQLDNTIFELSKTLDNFSREAGVGPNHQLKKELGKLCYYFLTNSYPDNLSFFSKRVKFLHMVLDSINKAAITVKDPYVPDPRGLEPKPYMIIGIEKSMIHKETPCCSLLSFFYVNAQIQFCNDISNAVQCFNESLDRSLNHNFLL